MGYNAGVTNIDDLIDLEHMSSTPLEHNNFTLLPPDMRKRYKAHVRPAHIIPPESGMTVQPSGYSTPIEHKKQRPMYSCMDIVQHIEGCPICTRYYDTNFDKTPYLVIIVILSIICVLLIKRVLEI